MRLHVIDCYKCKKVALHSVTEIEGLDSLSFDMKESTLTVIGDADPVCVANLLRKKFRCAEVVYAGTMPPPREPKTPRVPTPAPPPAPPRPKCCHVCEAQCCSRCSACSCRPVKCCPPCSACSCRPDILWPQYQHPCANPGEVWYVWKEEPQDSCVIM